MLKVNYDERQRDYVDYLGPFVLFVLRGSEGNPISAGGVSQSIKERFSLFIPTNTVELFLSRMVKRRLLRREYGSYWISKPLPVDDLTPAQEKAVECITIVTSELQKFAHDEFQLEWDEASALGAVHAYLNRFGVDFLSSFKRHSVLPDLPEERTVKADFIINRFVQEIYRRQDIAWQSMCVLVQAHMLSNALLCPDLESLSKSFTRVTAYLDTRVVLRLLGLEGEEHRSATSELIDLLCKLDGRLSVFSHTLLELDRVIDVAAKMLNNRTGRGSVVWHARSSGMRRSDLLLLRAQVRPRLAKLGISVTPTPKYNVKYQIDENTLGEWLEDELYFTMKDRVKAHDINCIRSVYVLREGSSPARLEDANALFVTTNAALARSAYKYGKQIESSREVSAVVTAFSLSNIAWLKRPLEAGSLPMREMLAMAYGALQPSEQLWSRFLEEVDKMKGESLIDPRIHSVLRYDLRAREELMELTQGSEGELGASTVREIIRRVEQEIRGEQAKELQQEYEARAQTQEDLEHAIAAQLSHQEHLGEIADRVGRIIGWIAFIFLSALFVYGAIAATYFLSDAITWSWPYKYLTLLLALLGVIIGITNVIWGFTLRSIRRPVAERVSARMQRWLWQDVDAVSLGSSNH